MSRPEDVLTADKVREAVGSTSVLGEIRVLPSLASTNSYLRSAGRSEREGLVVVADHQTAGKGRQGRSWVAPPGSAINCSILLRPPMPADRLYLLTAACALAVQNALARIVVVQPTIKWPNDVMIGHGKVCGILTETELTHGAPPVAVVGFGINVHATPDPSHAPGATCVADHAARPISRLEVLAAVLTEYDRLLVGLYSGKLSPVREAWRSGLRPIGQRVTVRYGDGWVAGWARDVTPEGGLVLETDNDSTPLVIYAGDAIEDVSA